MPTESYVGDLVKIGHSHFNRIGNEISDRLFYWQLWCIFMEYMMKYFINK